ncbi:glycosyltransferase [Pelagibacterales bacterium SAG-MED11]|nr:glycosyltransferase [Pelagibacterales bacterium SAG-MED11]
MKKDNISVFSNDNFYYKNQILHYQNKNTFTLINLLRNKFRVNLISRKDKFKTINKKKFLNLNHENFFSLIKKIIYKENYRFLFISITPFNFFYFLILKILFIKKERIYLFLRSDGFKEYQIKFSYFGYFFYFFMFKIFCSSSNVLSCSRYFKRLKDFKILLPSELDKFWLKKDFNKKINKKISLLYVGRFRQEKGYLSLISIFKKMNKRLEDYHLSLTLVGAEKKERLKDKNIRIIKQVNNNKKLKKIYDSHQIFILPSYTEGYPQVILESLSRKKPVIIFNEIKFLKKIYPKGLFVSERNEIDFTRTIKHILSHYKKIINEINKINLTSKNNFKLNLIKQLQL